ncbi:Inherit from NOG: HTTM domain protein [Seminavis robusta]|uniref:Inherit from NOG: HTTM domain protein n=1 Tax=Seminavis robusta TaxID=568900 RepID=A0A9N8DEX8_9STRA|nr:Inherit from NOG: HTTM domain protein [Seminavis robusta]|eukprot:Sro62_g035510.1 Inherit from NOG: HTTM domain protein (612) ;mRNA; f:108233-110337
MLGCTYESLALYRISLGLLLVLELVSRFRFLHPFYSDEGTLPLRLLLPKIDGIYKIVCLHTHLHELWQIQVVLGIQVVAAVLFTVGYQTKLMTILSWYLYLSLTLRNTWLNFILDRYFHFLLFYAMFLPCDHCWSLSAWLSSRKQQNDQVNNNQQPPKRELVVSAGTIALKLLVVWIYLDAGGGKYMDPLQGWTYHAKPLPALDTYTRHTVFARYMYGMLGPEGLRVMTPAVVYVELLAAPLALLGAYLGSSGMANTAVLLICQLHVGIALCMNNAFLLSLVACTVWCIYLPIGWERISTEQATIATSTPSVSSVVSTLLIVSMVAGNVWFAFNSGSCDENTMIFYSTIFHCRWNVFVGAEEYVTWEIAPGLLVDGSVVDVWGQKDEVDWRLPGAGAPCTSTSRPGRWRSFPYLAELQGEDGEALWSYLCRQWDQDNHVDQLPGRQLIKFNFFMLQADVLPNMGFSATRKRLIHSYECVKTDAAAIPSVEEQTQEPKPGSSDQDVVGSNIAQQQSTEGDDRDESAEPRDKAPDDTSLEEEDSNDAISAGDNEPQEAGHATVLPGAVDSSTSSSTTEEAPTADSSDSSTGNDPLPSDDKETDAAENSVKEEL